MYLLMSKVYKLPNDTRARGKVVGEIRPFISYIRASDILANETIEQASSESFNPKQETELVKKRTGFKKKEVSRWPDVSGAAAARPLSTPHCTVQDLMNYASDNENIWKYNQHEKRVEKLANLYFREYGLGEELRIFIVKFVIFIEGIIEGKSAKAVWVKNMDADASVSKESLTLIGQRYFDLLNTYHSCNILQKNNFSDLNEFFNFLSVFDVVKDTFMFWKMNFFPNQQALELNKFMLDFRKKLIAYKGKYSKNFENINYVNEKTFQKIFIKDRWILRFELTTFKMHHDVRLLSKTFSDLMKRLEGDYRLSGDIKYIKFTNEKFSKKYLDVLFFIEPNEKFNSMEEVIHRIQDDWVRASSYTLNEHQSKDGKILTHYAETDAKVKQLMKSETFFNSEYLYIGTRDKTKIEAAVDVLIPYFISQAIFLPVESTLPKTRQLTQVGFGKKY